MQGGSIIWALLLLAIFASAKPFDYQIEQIIELQQTDLESTNKGLVIRPQFQFDETQMIINEYNLQKNRTFLKLLIACSIIVFIGIIFIGKKKPEQQNNQKNLEVSQVKIPFAQLFCTLVYLKQKMQLKLNQSYDLGQLFIMDLPINHQIKFFIKINSLKQNIYFGLTSENHEFLNQSLRSALRDLEGFSFHQSKNYHMYGGRFEKGDQIKITRKSNSITWYFKNGKLERISHIILQSSYQQPFILMFNETDQCTLWT